MKKKLILSILIGCMVFTSAAYAKPVATGETATTTPSLEEILKKVEVKTSGTEDGTMCAIITNNSDVIIDELCIHINYKDDSGATISTGEDWHDVVLPGSTVASRIDAPEKYSDYEVIKEAELDKHPNYENHAEDVEVKSNIGENCIIVEITNNAKVDIEEIEYITVFYKDGYITKVTYPTDVYDVKSGATVTEEVGTYDIDYDEYEIYLNQAHTFGI